MDSLFSGKPIKTDKERRNMIKLFGQVDRPCSRVLNILELFQDTEGLKIVEMA